ncbi:MAG: hypothetical protein CSA04_02660 [Bacteroidetes bacterium]|nr:MAG: hypothetical protein CSA04_02660 [Bacteroidota bacterium]
MMAVLFTACSSFKSQKISNSQDLSAVMEIVASHFPDDNLLHIAILADDHLSDKFETLNVYYYENDKVYVATYYEFQAGWLDPEKSPFHGIKKASNKVNRLKKASDFDFGNVQELLTKAILFIEENSDEFEDFKLYSIEQGSQPNGEMETKFTVNATKKDEGSTRQGRNIVTTYYEFNFIVDERGEITYQE